MTKTPEELTEDWEAGKLPAGWYYLKLENGEIELQNNCIGGFLCRAIIELSNPRPRFLPMTNTRLCRIKLLMPNVRLKNLKKKNVENLGYIGGLLNEGNEQVIKNRELRALLKECRPYLSYKINQNKHVGFTPDAANLLTRINATLGESEE